MPQFYVTHSSVKHTDSKGTAILAGPGQSIELTQEQADGINEAARGGRSETDPDAGDDLLVTPDAWAKMQAAAKALRNIGADLPDALAGTQASTKA
jgi:NACalpha-BTF3-like transcription factor